MKFQAHHSEHRNLHSTKIFPGKYDHLIFTVNPVFEVAASIAERLLQKQRLWQKVNVRLIIQ